jgi:hypothetical protein
MAYYPNLQVIKQASPVIDRERGKIGKRKPYKFPKQYTNYQTFLELIVVSQLAKKLPSEFDRTYAQSSLWDSHNIPVYGISEDTLALFQAITPAENIITINGHQSIDDVMQELMAEALSRFSNLNHPWWER